MEVYIGKEGKEKLISGINKLAEVVKTTYGPNGKTVIIPSKTEFGKYIVTKDGVSVAEQVKFKDPIENIGANLIKEAAKLTVKTAGDGTSGSTILANALINNLKDFDYKEVEKKLNVIIPEIIKHLKLNSKELKREDIKYVAGISANNDQQIANAIQQAYNFSDIVKVEESNLTEDKIELIGGMKLNTSYISKHFINNPKKAQSCLYEPYVLMIDGKLDNIKPITNVLNKIASENESILIITEHVHENVLRPLESHVLSGNLQLSIMKSPGFSSHRKNLLKDISKFTNSFLFRGLDREVKLSDLGKLSAISISSDHSVLVKDKDVNVEDLISDLEYQLKESSEEDRELLQQRIENLKGQISIIKVGGTSELEMKERFDRYDDAVRAVQCALEEGIVEGGGEALYRISLNKTSDPIELLIYDSIKEPVRKIDSRIDARNISMFDRNIIDPLKVTRCALENAVSVAKTVLSTEAIVLNENEWNH